ncbi:MAG: Aspartate aminotransferase [Chlamydiae bacterium]|nr:Aspartate aminotransferase [Chlamydiota bacterium]
MSFFKSIEMPPEDPILHLSVMFAGDNRSQKVNLGVGAYKNTEGKPQVLSCVRQAEAIILEKHLNKEYLPIQGNSDYISASLKLVFGENSPELASGRIFGAQTLGGTGALRVGGELLAKNQVSETIFLSDPTWPNHKPIFARAGMKLDTYPYYDERHRSLNYSGMCESIKRMPAGSTIILQPCCQNPTGLDPSMEQWKEISQLVRQKQLIPFFDFAYQGFDQGVEQDAQVVRYFVQEGHEMLVASSFSKNFGLYGERVGMLSVVCADIDTTARVGGQIKQVIRGNYSMPPLQGQRIVTTILQSPELKKEWEHELANMRDRIKEMRSTLLSGLMAKGASEFEFLGKQTGMFSYSGLNPDQVHRLQSEHGIYMPGSGRINVAGLNSQNMDYVINSMLAVL